MEFEVDSQPCLTAAKNDVAVKTCVQYRLYWTRLEVTEDNIVCMG